MKWVHRAMIFSLALLLAGCAAAVSTPPATSLAASSSPGGYDASRLGALSDEGILIGEGHVQGSDSWGVEVDIEWQILAYQKDITGPGHLPRQACTTWVFHGVSDVGAECASISPEDGLPGVGLSLGQPTVISGLLNPSVSEVRIELGDGEFIPQLVPLEPVGMEGSGFALVLIDERPLVAVREYNARGSLLREHRPPDSIP